MSKESKHHLDRLFALHAAVAMVLGVISLLFPHLAEYFLIPQRHEQFGLVDHSAGDSQKVTHLVLRLYGILILADGHIVFRARKVADAYMRRSLVQTHSVCFLLTSFALARAQMTQGGDFSPWNWANVGGFAVLGVWYGWFVFNQPISSFESLDRLNV